MVANHMKTIAAGVVAVVTFGAPAIAAAQSYRYVDDDRPSVVVEWESGQRAVMEQRRVSGRTQVVARCEADHTRRKVVSGDTRCAVHNRRLLSDPDGRHVVQTELAIVRDNRGPLNPRLRNQHSVEGVRMVRREGGDLLGMGQPDRQFDEITRGNH